MNIECILNKEKVIIQTRHDRRLLDVLRDDFALTSVKEGCGEGECGVCSVLIDGKLINSCLLPIGHVHQKEVMTLEGYRKTKRFVLIKEAFMEAGAVQCGFCTPGIVLAVEALLSKHPNPSKVQIIEAISGNLCRCTGYQMIIDGILKTIEKENGSW